MSQLKKLQAAVEDVEALLSRKDEDIAELQKELTRLEQVNIGLEQENESLTHQLREIDQHEHD